MNIKPDDYFNNGFIEMARFGRKILFRNNENLKPMITKKLVKKYPILKKKIDKSVLSIRKKVSKCNPLQLLSFASDLFLTNNLNIDSEIQLTQEKIYSSRITEYIQSILVSTPNKYRKSKKDPSKRFFRLKKDICKLYATIDAFYLCWAAYITEQYSEFDEEDKKVIIESQLLYTVRGQRYQVFEHEYFERLLTIHNDIFLKLFSMSSCEVIQGIKKLQYSLSQEKFDVINDLMKLMDEFSELSEDERQHFYDNHSKQSQDFKEKFLGTKLHDVIEVTKWSESFVDSLSYNINENLDFFNKSEFSGWPIIDLPIQKRPFIKIDNHYYCFDYYSFVDNFYRSIQKTISRLAPDYNWNKMQMEASEKMVADVFSQILPGCIIYRDNYYPKNNSIKNAVENDLIIIYAEVLIIVEVKAGSFVYTAPMTDFESHISSYKSLVEKADWQCKNTYDYLTSENTPCIYDSNRKVKAKIDMSEISDIFMMSVTIDNINDFAARAEKLNFLQLKCNAISVSIDDLMVYREYFDSPLVFLHFLKQRRQATQEEKLALNDELDHLGMYIQHNWYSMQLRDVPKETEMIFYGYREELDKYFCSLYHSELNPQKPSLPIPDLFMQIFKYLIEQNIKNRVRISNYFLDFSPNARQSFCDQIQLILNRQKTTGNMLAFGTSGSDEFSLRYTCFVEQPNINTFTDNYKRDYVLSTLIWNEEQDRVMIDLKFNKRNKFVKLKFTLFSVDNISESEYSRLKNQGRQRALMRLKAYINKYGKIEEDNFCPCGSGKIYKQCCGRKEEGI